MKKTILYASLGLMVAFGTAGCLNPTETSGPEFVSNEAAASGTCTGVYPSYWQDDAEKFQDMWADQAISNVPPNGWSGPIFRLSDAYPSEPVDDASQQAWRDSRFDALFDPSTDLQVKRDLAWDYAWAVMDYIMEGNTERNWDVCENSIRPWYHMPFQTYQTLSGREFTHGLTREAPRL